MATYPHPTTGEPLQMYRIEKKYSQSSFEDNATSLGYKIDVYQETINKVFPEYLVNFTYFTRLMEEYGFNLVENAKTGECGLGNATGMFRELFDSMPGGSESRRLYGEAANMSDAEKAVSFLNRYFVFQKNRNVAVDIVFNKQMAMAENEVEPSLSTSQSISLPTQGVASQPSVENISIVSEKPVIERTKRTYKPRKTAPKKEEIKTDNEPEL
jgi:hypothetical protein